MEKSVVWNPEMFRKHYEYSVENNDVIASSEERCRSFYLHELKLDENDVVLDVGCGYGRLSKIISPRVKQVIGIDINPENLSYAKNYVGDKFKGIIVDLSSGFLPFENKSIDKIMVDNVLMFFDDQRQHVFFEEFHRILKDGGILVFNFENSEYLFSSLFKMFSYMYKLKAKMIGRLTPDHHVYSFAFYEKILNKLGFTNIVSIGNTFYQKMGVGQFELFPKFLLPYLSKLDKQYYKMERKYKMASLTVAAKK